MGWLVPELKINKPVAGESTGLALFISEVKLTLGINSPLLVE